MALATPEMAPREPAVAGRPCAPPLAYDLHPAGKPPVLRVLHPEQCRACRCDVGSRVGSPRRATGLDALGAHRSHTVGPVHGCTCPPVYLEATGFETSWVWPSGLEKTAKIAASPSSEVRLWSLELPPAQVLKSAPDPDTNLTRLPGGRPPSLLGGGGSFPPRVTQAARRLRRFSRCAAGFEPSNPVSLPRACPCSGACLPGPLEP